MSFNYDEIIQIRIAVLEAAEMAMKYTTEEERPPGEDHIAIRFDGASDKLEMLILPPKGYKSQVAGEKMVESQALIRSLMDELEFGSDPAGKPWIRLAKHKSAG